MYRISKTSHIKRIQIVIVIVRAAKRVNQKNENLMYPIFLRKMKKLNPKNLEVIWLITSKIILRVNN